MIFRSCIWQHSLEDEKLKTALTILFVIIAIALTILVLSQEGKDQGFGSALSGTVDTYWSKNKKRSKEGLLVRGTAVMIIIFFVIVMLLNTKLF